jgi:hypothetical protein
MRIAYFALTVLLAILFAGLLTLGTVTPGPFGWLACGLAVLAFANTIKMGCEARRLWTP